MDAVLLNIRNKSDLFIRGSKGPARVQQRADTKVLAREGHRMFNGIGSSDSAARAEAIHRAGVCRGKRLAAKHLHARH